MQAKTNDTTVARGREAESEAAAYLAGRGLRLRERNFRVRGGEIDLIMQDGATVVFVEVRARSRSDFGDAGASIDAFKQERIVLAARHWLARHGECACRFDCVLIDDGHLRWLRNAFAGEH